MNKKNK